MRSALFSGALALAALQLCAAQTSTVCDPTKKTCPADPALGKTITVDFTQGKSDQFTPADGTTMTYGSDGAAFTINKESDAPTIVSNWYIFFGKVDVVLRASPGVGIVSSFVMESDDLDEIDWEWLGGDLTEVETNYFGKGNVTTYDRATYVPVASPQTTFHTYTIDWTSASIKWSIDGNVIRTLAYGDANGGSNFPQTPMQVKIGNWVGGSSTAPQGTVQWAGGLTDFSKAPFVFNVKSVTIQDYSTGGSQYVYGDQSGSWQSIKTDGTAGGSSNSSSSSSASANSTASATSTVSSASNSTKSTSAATTAATASSGLGGGAVTQSAGTTPTGTASGSAAATSKASAGDILKVSSSALTIIGMGLGYLFL